MARINGKYAISSGGMASIDIMALRKPHQHGSENGQNVMEAAGGGEKLARHQPGAEKAIAAAASQAANNLKIWLAEAADIGGDWRR